MPCASLVSSGVVGTSSYNVERLRTGQPTPALCMRCRPSRVRGGTSCGTSSGREPVLTRKLGLVQTRLPSRVRDENRVCDSSG